MKYYSPTQLLGHIKWIPSNFSLNNLLKMLVTLDRFKGKIAVVTGASAGIGAAILEKLILEGVNVVGLARRVERVEKLGEKLNKLNKGQVYGIKCDISSEEDVVKAFEWIEKNLGPIHILINNAGIIKKNTLIDGDYQKWKQIFDTNVLGLCVATREAVKSMKKHDVTGHILNIGSVAGKQVPPYPGVNVYSGSKFAVSALTETLRYELLQDKSNIKITCLNPGYVLTEIISDPEYEETRKLMENIPSITADQVADTTIYVLSTPPEVQIKELTIHSVHET